MITPEKNDVDVTKLFHWGDVFTITLPGGNSMDVYVRVVSDEEMNKARVYALRKANIIKEELYRKNSDLHTAYMPNINKAKKEDIINMILMYELPNLQKIATRETNVPFPKEPDEDASTIEWVEYQKQIDEYPKKLAEAINERLNTEVKLRRLELSKMTKEDLKRLLENRVTEVVVSKELEERFLDACVYYGTFQDPEYTKRVFKSPEQVTQLPVKIRDQFISAYMAIDIPMEELKKLRGATL